MGGPRINYKKMDRLIKAKKKTWDQIGAALECSKSAVVNRAAKIGEQRWRVAPKRIPSEPRKKSHNYLAHLGQPEESTRPLEGLSSEPSNFIESIY